MISSELVTGKHHYIHVLLAKYKGM